MQKARVRLQIAAPAEVVFQYLADEARLQSIGLVRAVEVLERPEGSLVGLVRRVVTHAGISFRERVTEVQADRLLSFVLLDMSVLGHQIPYRNEYARFLLEPQGKGIEITFESCFEIPDRPRLTRLLVPSYRMSLLTFLVSLRRTVKSARP